MGSRFYAVHNYVVTFAVSLLGAMLMYVIAGILFIITSDIHTCACCLYCTYSSDRNRLQADGLLHEERRPDMQ